MPVRDEIRDPWSYVVGGLAGGFAWAVVATAASNPVGIALGAAVGGAVFATKVVTGAFTRRGQRRAKRRERNLPVLTRTPEASWLNRAQEAQETFDDIAGSASDGPIADSVRTFGDQTDESLSSLARLAGQASAIRSALARLDLKQLGWERDRLKKAASADEDPRLIAERERALAAVESQLDAYRRLDGTLQMLLARLESGTLGIEGLVARLAEVVAMATTATVADELSRVDELAQELEGLRAGLAEAESVTNRAMRGLAPSSVAIDDSPARQRARGE